MSYYIQTRTYQMARHLGVKIKPSEHAKYKIDVFDWNGNYITSIGARGMGDYPTYLEMEKDGEVPKGYADTRRRLYWGRHKKEIERLGAEWEGSRSYYALLLLW